MPDGNTNLIDGLTVQIAASVNPAVSAVDTLQTKLRSLSRILGNFGEEGKHKTALDNLSSGFERLDRAVNSLDIAKMEAACNSIKGVANAMKGVTKVTSKFDESSSNSITSFLQGISSVNVPDFTNLATLTKSLEKLGKDKATAGSANLSQMLGSLQSIGGIAIPDFTNLERLAKSISKLGSDRAQNAAWVLPNIMAELESFATHFGGLALNEGSLNAITQLGSAFSRLGGRNASEAIVNLPLLSDAIRQMVDDLNNLPQVSAKTQELVVALGNLAKNNTNVAQTTSKLGSKFNALGTVMSSLGSRAKSWGNYMVNSWKNTNALKSALDKLKNGAKSAFDSTSNSVANFSKNILTAKSHTESLVSVIIKARAIIWGLKQAFSTFSESIDLASNLVEVQNVIDNVYTENYADKIEDMSKSVIQSLGMSELSFKQYASRYQAMGKAMDITNSQMAASQDNLRRMGVAYGEATGNMQDMSVNLTQLAADLASFYDISQEEAYTKLQAIYTGQTRPLTLAA